MNQKVHKESVVQHDHAVPSAFSLQPSAFKRIAYCSPVNPVPSGISDYSEELLPYLAQYADITLFAERDVVPTNEQLRQHLAVKPLDLLRRLHRQRPFDAIVYHMGNSPAHATIYELIQHVPGVVVLHDWVLHHFKLWYAAKRQKNVGAYGQEMRTRYGAAGERVARHMSRGQLHDRAFAMPLVEDLIEHAHGLIGHSRLVVERAQALRPGLPTAHVPMGVPLPPLLERDAARAALGLAPNAPIWASFGHINPYKRIESTLRAFARFHALHPDARYVLVGSVSPNYDVHALVRRLGLDEAVMITGHVPHAVFAQYVAAADLCLNLRAPTAGETSASLLRLLAAGRPTLVSALDTFNELPDDVCAKVEPDRSEGALILAYAHLLHQHLPLADALGSNARRYIATQHTLDGAADGYMRFLSHLYGWGDVPKQRAPLWDVEDREQETGIGYPLGAVPGELETPGHRDTGTRDTISVQRSNVPTFQHSNVPTSSAFSLASVSQAAAELGVRADDVPLQHVAATIGDLFAG